MPTLIKVTDKRSGGEILDSLDDQARVAAEVDKPPDEPPVDVPAASVEKVSLASLEARLAEVNEALAAEQTSQTTSEAPYGYRADGVTPRKTPGGRPTLEQAAANERDKQRARLRSVTPNKVKPQAAQPMQTTALAVVNYQAMGESVASLWFNGGVAVFGPEWEPDMEQGEHLAVASAFRDYFKAINAKDLPPGFALCFVLSVYTLKRTNRPTIKQKLQNFGEWARSKVRRTR